jgi:hypothetical protein
MLDKSKIKLYSKPNKDLMKYSMLHFETLIPSSKACFIFCLIILEASKLVVIMSMVDDLRKCRIGPVEEPFDSRKNSAQACS